MGIPGTAGGTPFLRFGSRFRIFFSLGRIRSRVNSIWVRNQRGSQRDSCNEPILEAGTHLGPLGFDFKN